MGSFVQRRIDVTFTLSGDVFSSSSEADSIKFRGLRVLCEIYNPPQAEMNRAQLSIYGISQEVMNRLTRMLWTGEVANGLANDLIKIEAGTNDNDMTTVFIGNIISAYPDYQNIPNVPLVVYAQTVALNQMASEQMKSVYQADTWKGDVKVADMAKKIASDMGLSFENNGVESTLRDQYLWNTPLAKMKTLADIAEIDYYITDSVLSICKRNKQRNVYAADNAPIISPETGMIGYPVPYMMGAVYVNVLFDSKIVHGGLIKIDTMAKAVNDNSLKIDSAQGFFFVLSMDHFLDSELPDGNWYTRILAVRSSDGLGA